MDRYGIMLGKPSDEEKLLEQAKVSPLPILSDRDQFFKGETGKEYRIGFIYEKDNDHFVGARVHWFNRYFLCKSTDSHRNICCTSNYEGNRARWRFSAVIVIYPNLKWTNRQIKPEVKRWTFGERNFVELCRLGYRREGNHKITADLYLQCIRGEFQQFTITSYKKCFWRESRWFGHLMKEANPIIGTRNQFLGQDLGISEMEQMFRENNIH